MSNSAVVSEYMEWLSSSISRYEELAKQAIAHHGEKGRIVESVLKSASRAVLPHRFSIGTGFAITGSGKISSQLDIIIYDNWFNAPIILEGGTGLFPIECIYGFIEVKSSLDASEIDKSATAIGRIRSFAAEKTYISHCSVNDQSGRPVVGEIEINDVLPPRSFVFAVRSCYSSIESIKAKLRASTEQHGAHIHGLSVLEKDWFLSQIAYRIPHEFDWREKRSLPLFCASVLQCIQSIGVRPASMAKYLDLRQT